MCENLNGPLCTERNGAMRGEVPDHNGWPRLLPGEVSQAFTSMRPRVTARKTCLTARTGPTWLLEPNIVIRLLSLPCQPPLTGIAFDMADYVRYDELTTDHRDLCDRDGICYVAHQRESALPQTHARPPFHPAKSVTAYSRIWNDQQAHIWENPHC